MATKASDSPVPLDTLPISPAGGSTNDENGAPNGTSNSEVITVFHDPDNFNVKHPLTHSWTLWFTKPPTGKVSPWTGDLGLYSFANLNM
jgi:translation initiation factor 4E